MMADWKRGERAKRLLLGTMTAGAVEQPEIMLRGKIICWIPLFLNNSLVDIVQYRTLPLRIHHIYGTGSGTKITDVIKLAPS